MIYSSAERVELCGILYFSSWFDPIGFHEYRNRRLYQREDLCNSQLTLVSQYHLYTKVHNSIVDAQSNEKYEDIEHIMGHIMFGNRKLVPDSLLCINISLLDVW